MTRHSMHAVAFLVISATISPSFAGPKEDLLKNAGNKVEAAYSRRNDNEAKPMRESIDRCLKAIDDAVAGGATLDDEIQVPTKTPGSRKTKNARNYPVTVAPLRDGQALCTGMRSKPDLLELGAVMQRVELGLPHAKKVLDAAAAKTGFDNQARAEAGSLLDLVKACRTGVDRAVAAGLAPATEFKLRSIGPVALSDAKTKTCDVLETTANAIIAAEDAKLEKKIAPYKAVLNGQRLSTFLNRKMYNDAIYGAGGKLLDTPAKLAAASAWFIVISGDIGFGLQKVTVRRYAWKGNQLGSVAERHGCCI